MASFFLPRTFDAAFQAYVADKFGVEWLDAKTDWRTMICDRIVIIRPHGDDVEVFCGDPGVAKLLQDDFAAMFVAEPPNMEAHDGSSV